MAVIEDILERATIKFPSLIGYMKAGQLLFHISEGIQGEVQYSSAFHTSFVYDKKEKKSHYKLGDKSFGV